MYLLTLVAIQLEFSSSAHVLICSLLLASNLLIVFFLFVCLANKMYITWKRKG